LAVHTRSSSLPRPANARARFAAVVGLASVLCVPAGVVLSWYSETVTLIQSFGSAALGFLLGLYAVILARRGRETVERTLGRAGGRGAARAGKLLGALGICVAITTGLAVGFYALLTFLKP
jgi:hypothetical protein